MRRTVLILCTGNSCRSQMAEAWWNLLGSDSWRAYSAGSRPAGYVHPIAIDVMREAGIDISQCRSKHVDEFQGQPFDAVVTVCDNANEACPSFPGGVPRLHWPFDDPATIHGTREEIVAGFRRVRDEIRDKIATFLEQAENSPTTSSDA
jgi:arsenate reductase